MQTAIVSAGFAPHDHRRCIATAVQAVQAACRAGGLRLTSMRERVLRILLREHCALGAYEILNRLRAQGLEAHPPAAYRALDFLVMHGFAHRIEYLSAFIACAHPGTCHNPAFMICRCCARVAEAVLALPQLEKAAATAGFEIERMVIETEGVCGGCRQAPAP